VKGQSRLAGHEPGIPDEAPPARRRAGARGEALLDAGAVVLQEVMDVGGGKLIASVKDADGNGIGLIQAR
jgi:hypothetical protein